MSAFKFGRAMKRAFELPPAPPPPANKPAPAPPPLPPPPPAANKTPTWSNFWTGDYNPSNPTPADDYRRTMSRYISPWNKDNAGAGGNDRGPIDEALKWGTRGAFGTAAVAGTTAAGLAAAPAVSSAMTGGAGTTAAAGTGGAAAGSQTPAGQNLIQRGSQMAGDVVQRGSQLANTAAQTYQSRVAPTLERLNYKPEDVAQDVFAVGTGHPEKIKGPGWGFKTPGINVTGAPSFPRPVEAWKNLLSTNTGMLPNPTSTANVAHMKAM